MCNIKPLVINYTNIIKTLVMLECCL